jgi:hypothetical protein
MLGHSPIHAPSNQILQPIISGGANPPNAHFTNAYGSMVGGITGCGGAGGSAAALAGNPGYNIELKQYGGSAHRRGGYKKRSNKRCKCRGKCHCKSNKRCKCRGKCHCKSNKRGQSKRGQSKRRHRGGMASFSPASFSGANPPYHQYGSNTPNSPVFSLGGALSPALSGMASPPPIDSVANRCS